MFLYLVYIFTTVATALAINPASSPHNWTISSDYEPANKINKIRRKLQDGKPPYWGTIFVEQKIITSQDSTSYEKEQYKGTGYRTMYDRRVGWITVTVFIYEVIFKRGVKMQFLVHNEFENSQEAIVPVKKYAKDVGKMPMAMLEGISQIWIMKGVYSWGGGVNNDGTGHILIHTGRGDEYTRDGIVEETLMHEGAHAVLDNMMYGDAWFEAAAKDKNYISDYAQEYPKGEDISETFLLYFAAEYTKKRLSKEDLTKIVTSVPHRIEYLNSLNMDMYPYKRLNVCRNKEICEDDNNFCTIDKCKRKNREKKECNYSKVKKCKCVKATKKCKDAKRCCSLTCEQGRCT